MDLKCAIVHQTIQVEKVIKYEKSYLQNVPDISMYNNSNRSKWLVNLNDWHDRYNPFQIDYKQVYSFLKTLPNYQVVYISDSHLHITEKNN